MSTALVRLLVYVYCFSQVIGLCLLLESGYWCMSTDLVRLLVYVYCFSQVIGLCLLI